MGIKTSSIMYVFFTSIINKQKFIGAIIYYMGCRKQPFSGLFIFSPDILKRGHQYSPLQPCDKTFSSVQPSLNSHILNHSNGLAQGSPQKKKSSGRSHKNRNLAREQRNKMFTVARAHAIKKSKIFSLSHNKVYNWQCLLNTFNSIWYICKVTVT